MRQTPLALRALMITAAVIATTSGLTATAASAETTGTITGRFTTSDGAGVPASVVVSGPTFAFTATGLDGSYALTGLAEGTYRVRFAPAGRPIQYAYSTANFAQAALIEVTAGQTATVNDTLLPLGHISGRFLNPDGSGVGSAFVTALSADFANPSAHTFTAPDGAYTLNVLPGQYKVSFQPNGGGLTQYAYSTTNWATAQIFTVAADQTVTVDDTLIETGSISGRVTAATGEAVANAQITAVGNGIFASGRTDASGNYSITGLQPGDYQIAIETSPGMRMYAPQTRSQEQAQVYQVTGGQVNTVDVTLLPTGTVTGRFTQNGTGVSGVDVRLRNQHGSGFTRTDMSGNYRLDHVFAGDGYLVEFDRFDLKIHQWAFGETTQARADVFTLAPGATLTVNDERLPTGTVRITARDSLTGTQIQELYAEALPFSGRAEDGVITMTDIPIGTYRMGIFSPDYESHDVEITVREGEQADVAVELDPLAKVRVSVVDAVSGAPVPGMCVIRLTPTHATRPDGCDGSTDGEGKLEMLTHAGDYNLMAIPEIASGYGMQWVGPSGGTGDQRQAALISVAKGQTVSAPTIRLDRAGSITGTVTSETGQPMRRGRVTFLTSHSGLGGEIGPEAGIGQDGTYRLDGLGPYEWPLLVASEDHAPQWSGVEGSRFDAVKVPVTSGGSAIYDHVAQVGTTITGTVRDSSGSAMDGYLNVFNAETGDFSGQVFADGVTPFSVRVLNQQQVKVELNNSWYLGRSFAHSGRVVVGSREVTLHMCMAGPDILRPCKP
ncbi:MAG TPA: carboxypeptidase regulatory-like domain-containing protein [Candidatus Limnocylindrales bacterium]